MPRWLGCPLRYVAWATGVLSTPFFLFLASLSHIGVTAEDVAALCRPGLLRLDHAHVCCNLSMYYNIHLKFVYNLLHPCPPLELLFSLYSVGLE